MLHRANTLQMKLILTKVSVRAFQRAAHSKLHNQGLNISSLRIYHNIPFFNLLMWKTKKGKTSEVSQILRTSQLRFNTFDGRAPDLWTGVWAESELAVAWWWGRRSSADGRLAGRPREQLVLGGLSQLRLSHTHKHTHTPLLHEKPHLPSGLNQEVTVWMWAAEREREGGRARHVVVLCIRDKYLLSNSLTVCRVWRWRCGEHGGGRSERNKVMFIESALEGNTAGSRARAAEKPSLKRTAEWARGWDRGVEWEGKTRFTAALVYTYARTRTTPRDAGSHAEQNPSTVSVQQQQRTEVYAFICFLTIIKSKRVGLRQSCSKSSVKSCLHETNHRIFLRSLINSD